MCFYSSRTIAFIQTIVLYHSPTYPPRLNLAGGVYLPGRRVPSLGSAGGVYPRGGEAPLVARLVPYISWKESHLLWLNWWSKSP